MNTHATLEKITSLAKRRGFIYPSSEIYGGMANSWDFGHYGYLLKKNIFERWFQRFVTSRDDMVALDASIFLNPKVWEVSGHVENFTDSMVDCKKCNTRTRADHLIEDKLKDIKVEGKSPEELTAIIKEHNIPCPVCGSRDFTDVRRFNLLFQTQLGIIEGDKSLVYLRGELAQGIFVNFKNVIDTMRVRMPFGIAQHGKAFRNEITLGQFLHRSIEFDLMEFEYFTHPGQTEEMFEMWMREMEAFAQDDLGIEEGHIRWREHSEEERSHYSSRTTDLEYQYPFGWKEMFGLANRTDFDLKNHMAGSGKNMEYRDPVSGEVYVPHVVEPTFGLSRLVGIIMFEAYREEEVGEKTRTYLKLHPSIAPVKAAVFPLQKDDKLRGVAQDLYKKLKKRFVTEYDDSGNIGKMYRRQDEIGTPYCITVDYDTLSDSMVTLRERDSMEQTRVHIDEVVDRIANSVASY